MRKLKNTLFMITIAIFLTNCGKNEKLLQAEKTVKDLFNYLNEDNTQSMDKIYPEMSDFDNYYKSDSILIRESGFINDSTIIVSITNYYTNLVNKKTNTHINLYVAKDSLENYKYIRDSKGLTNLNDGDFFEFAKNTGCINKKDTTDVQLNNKYNGARFLAYNYTLEKISYFKNNVKVVNWNWETGYGNSASGKGIVMNKTSFDIPNVQYEIKYKDKNKNVITSDDGYVSFDILKSGESKSFTFYTSYVGNSSMASISLKFDEDMILDYVLNDEYNGDEYDLYLSETNQPI